MVLRTNQKRFTAENGLINSQGPTVWVIDRQDSQRPPIRLGEWCTRVASEVFRECRVAPVGEVSVVLVDDPGMQELNRDYRGQDRTTDVIAFPQQHRPWSSGADEPGPGAEDEGPVWGDLAINLSWSRRTARELEHPVNWEIGLLLVHGLLHLLGYDHHDGRGKRRMQLAEWKVLRKCVGPVGAAKILRDWREESRK